MTNIITSVRKKVLGGIMQFDMIKNNDKIIVAVSGGKDSLAMLDILYYLQSNSQFKFSIIPVYVVPSVKGIITFNKELEEIFKKYSENYIIHKLRIPKSSKLRQGIAEGKTCQWCTYARRITLFKLAERLGANKIAYGHHMDDLITTLFMNVHISKWLKIIPPVNKMRKGDFALIRPLVRVRESDLIRYCEKVGLVPLKANCPLEKISKRKQVNGVLKDIELTLPNFVEDMYNAYIKKFGNDFETNNSKNI